MWEPNLGAGCQGQLLLNNDIKASAFQPCVTLSTQETGKAIYLGGRKGRPENVFSGPSSQLGFGSSGQPTKPAPRASVPRSGPCAAYTFQALQTHFQVSVALPVGKETSGVYQHHSGCHAGVTQPRAPGTSHGPLAKSGRQSPGLQKTEAESTASSDRRKQTATGGLCRQLMGRPALGLPRLKMPVGAPRPQL